MIYLILAVLSSAAIGTVIRSSGDRVRGRTWMLTVNYAIAAVIGAVSADWGAGASDGTAFALWFGAVNGAIYLISLIAQQVCTHANGVVMATVFSRLGGLLLPMVMSAALFGDRPGPLRIAGAVLAVLSIVGLSARSGSASAASSFGALALLFVSSGAANATAKIYDVFGSKGLHGHYLTLTFGTALVLCAALSIKRGERLGRAEIIFGTMLGVPNILASRFMLMALSELPASIVYPTQGVAIIALLSLVGAAIFGERLSKIQWASIGLVLASVVLLNL